MAPVVPKMKGFPPTGKQDKSHHHQMLCNLSWNRCWFLASNIKQKEPLNIFEQQINEPSLEAKMGILLKMESFCAHFLCRVFFSLEKITVFSRKNFAGSGNLARGTWWRSWFKGRKGWSWKHHKRKGFDDDNVEKTEWKWRTAVWFCSATTLFVFFFVFEGQLEVFVNVGY